MKKLSIALAVFFTLILMTGCPDKPQSEGSEENKTNVRRIDMKVANTMLQNYMRFLMNGNHGAMKAFYSAELKKKIKVSVGPAGVAPVGYAIGEGESMQDKANYKINVFNSNKKELYFSNDEFKYELKLEGSKTVIDKITKQKSVELYKEQDSLFKRDNEKLKGTKIISLKDLPSFVVANEAAALEQKYPMPKKEFGPSVISPDDKLIVISTMDQNSFVGMLTEEESSSATFSTMEKQGAGQGEDKGKSQGGAQQQQGGESGGSQEGTNYKIKTVDLYFGFQVKNISFSQDGKLFVVEYGINGGASKIAVYKSDSGEKQILKSNRQFSSKFSMTKPYFASPNELVFMLQPQANASSADRKLKGFWRLDLEKGIVKQF